MPWYLVHTKPRQEARALALIELLSKQVRLPLAVTQIRAWCAQDTAS